jgi:hypothetical protein
MMRRFRLICRFAVADGVPRRALWVAVVVGTVLNLINQGDAIVAGGPIDAVKMALTYLVPYCVATYGAVSYRLHAAAAARGGRSHRRERACRHSSLPPGSR